MRAPASCILPLLLAGLLAGSAEGYSVKGALQNLTPQQGVVKGLPENSKENIEDDTGDDPDYVPEYDKVYDDNGDDDNGDDDNGDVPTEDGSGGYSAENDAADQEGGRSFIASEETEDGKLWISDDDPDWTPSQGQEGKTYEDDNTQDTLTQEDVNSQEDGPAQGGIPPFPDATSDPGGVVAEFGIGDSQGSASEKDTQEDYRQESFPAKGKRNVKRSYQVSKQVVQEPEPVVQEPQQVVQVSAPHGNEQGKVDSGISGSIQEGSGGYPGVSTGVEPVQPVGGPQLHEVGAGVEPEQGEASGDKDKESGGSTIGGWFKEGWNKFTGAVEDLGDRTEDSFRSLGDKVETAAGHIQETISAAVDRLHQAYDNVREKLPQILERFKALILKFGAVVQEGALYCLQRFEHTIDKVRGSQVIVKLEKQLQEGHAEVAKFFQILGEKVQAWRVQHGSGDVDSGLLEPGKPVPGQVEQEGGPHRQGFEDMPDFFQDDQVIVQLNKLKEVGVLTDDDIIILTQEHNTQDKQNQHNQNVDSQQEGNQNVGSQQGGNQNVDSQQEGNQNVDSHQEGNLNVDSHQEGNQNVDSQQEGNQNVDSQQEGNQNVNSHQEGNQNANSHQEGNQNANSQQEQNQNLNSQQEQSQDFNFQQEQNQNLNSQQEENQDFNSQQEQNQNVNSQQGQNQNYDSQQQNQQQSYYYNQQRSQSTGQAIQFPH